MSEQPAWFEALEKSLGQSLSVSLLHGGEQVVEVSVEQLLAAVRALRASQPMGHLSAITARAVTDGLELLYHFWLDGGVTLRVRCGRATGVPSLTPEVPAASWYEREIHDLFGLRFDGHPNLAPLLLSQDWDGPPPFTVEESAS